MPSTANRDADEAPNRPRPAEPPTTELEAELANLRRAHETLSRRLVAERAAFADGIARVQASVYSTRSWRYTAPLRAAIRTLRRLKP